MAGPIDITTTSSIIHITMPFHHVTFNVRTDLINLGRTSKNLEKFLRESLENLHLSYENNTRDHIIHALSINVPDKLQQCMLLGVKYMHPLFRAKHITYIRADVCRLINNLK